jgi:nucleotide-binding universal stress UspA family protein
MSKTVLCPIDFSDSSLGALSYAVTAAHAKGAGLTVLFSYRLIQHEKGEEILVFRKKMEEEARRQFKMLESKFKDQLAAVPDFLVQIGFISDSIQSYVRKHAVELLVLDRGIYHLLNDHGHAAPDEFLSSLNVPFVIVPEKTAVA